MVSVFPHLDIDAMVDAVLPDWTRPGTRPAPVPVVIPSLAFADEIERRIADRCGVCMGFDFMMPRDFVRKVLGTNRSDAWTVERLTWSLFGLSDTLVTHLGAESAPSRDRFAMAAQLADRFDQYAHFRPGLVRAWSVGQSGLPGTADRSARDTEDWQRALWSQVCEKITDPHPALIAQDLPPADLRRAAEAFPRLLVLGTGSIDPVVVSLLARLAATGSEIAVHVVLPTMGFLGDIRGNRDALPDTDIDPESIDVPAPHPLLVSMARHAIGSFALLGELDEDFSHWPETARHETIAPSLLARVQSDIRENRAPTHWSDGSDASLRVHACFGIRREAEVLRDELLRAFAELPDLRPEQVHIVTPDLDAYAPVIASVFESGPTPLPVRFCERPSPGADASIRGTAHLLQMARDGIFTTSSMLELARMDGPASLLGNTTLANSDDDIFTWIEASGSTHGVGHDAPGRWGFSRDRLIAGRFFGERGDTQYSDGDYVLPVCGPMEDCGGAREAFVEWHARLEATLREWQAPAPPDQWANRIHAAATAVLGVAPDGFSVLGPLLAALRTCDFDGPVDAGVIGDWLDTNAGASSRRGGISGRIAVGRFKQLQNIPCRVLAILGMHERAFPASAQSPAWDLLKVTPRIWDRNARVDDRQMFLDAVLTVGERLIITAPTRNIRTGRDEPMSVCVDELLRVTAAMSVPQEDLVCEHRLSPYSPGYFQDASGLLQSFDPEAARVAVQLGNSQRLPGLPIISSIGDGASSGTMPGSLALGEIIRFWQDPARAWLRAAGISPPDEIPDESALDWSPIELDGLARWNGRDQLLEASLTDPARGTRLISELRANRQLPPGHLGDRAWADLLGPVERLAKAVKSHVGERAKLETTIGQTSIAGDVLFDRSGSALLFYRVGNAEHPRHRIGQWITALFASVACGDPVQCLVLDDHALEQPRCYPGIPTDSAREILRQLLDGMALGHVAPLAFAPATTCAIAGKLITDASDDEALLAGQRAWEPTLYASAAEGGKPAAQLAWRDTDPFEQADAWLHLARIIGIPLTTWGPES